MMRFSELTLGLGTMIGNGDPEIAGVTEDSRAVAPGVLFVAVRGTALDGHAFTGDAVTRGAAGLVVERAETVPAGVPALLVPDTRTALARLAARFFDTPSLAPSLVGFTGTFGKTSTSEILRALLDAGGLRAGVLGSLGARYGSFRLEGSGLTTPSPVELHGALRHLHDAGAKTVIMEVTSHALRLGRVIGLQFSGGLLAAIMPGEHTDFHRSYEDYVEAKRLFLQYLATEATLAFDADNAAARQLASDAPARAVGFSTEARPADLRLSEAVFDAAGAEFTASGSLVGRTTGVRLRSALLGRGHLRNVGLALTYALAAGIPIETAAEVLTTLQPLRRRVESYGVGGRTVLDDTAAHPDSLRAIFEVASFLALRPLHVAYAVRGSRGAEVNRRNAVALAELCARHEARRLIVTVSTDTVGPADRVLPQEAEATRDALAAGRFPFTWHETLQGAMREALAVTPPGGLLVLLGAQGMNEGRRLLMEPAS